MMVTVAVTAILKEKKIIMMMGSNIKVLLNIKKCLTLK